MKKEGDGAVYFHCVYGKDRAGVFAAELLLALGVPEKTVVSDYAYSNTVAEFFSGLSQAAAARMKIVNETSIKNALKKVREKYGTYESYFEKGIGLSKKQLKKLRKKYLT